MKKILCLFFALCWLTSVTADTTITWAAPTQISTLGVNASGASVGSDPNGNTTAIWVESGNIVTRSLPFGGSWGSSTTLTSSGTASSPIVRVDNSGNAVAIWLDAGVVNSATLPFGGSWSVSTGVSSNTSTVTAPVLVVDGSGNALATWVNNGAIEVATKRFNQSWSLVSVLAATGSDQPHASIGANGTAMVVWHSVSGTQHAIQSSSSTVGGSWGATKPVFPIVAAFIHSNPKVTVDPNGNATVVWYRYSKTNNDFENVTVYSSSLNAGGSSWSLPQVVSNPGQRDPSTLSLGIKSDLNGNVVASWVTSQDGASFAFSVNAQPFGGTWTSSGSIAGNSFSGPDADMSMNAFGDAVAVYMFFDGTNAVIQATDSFYGGFIQNIWTPPSTVSTGTDNGFPRVASSFVSGAIQATAVWTQFNGTNSIINAATGARTLLGPPSNLAVTQSLTDYGIFQDYSNTITWDPSTDVNTTGYIVFRDGIFIAFLPSSALQFVDHNQVQNGSVTYGVAAVDGFDLLSQIQTKSFP